MNTPSSTRPVPTIVAAVATLASVIAAAFAVRADATRATGDARSAPTPDTAPYAALPAIADLALANGLIGLSPASLRPGSPTPDTAPTASPQSDR